MAYFLDLPHKVDSRGQMTIVDRILPYEIKRVFFLHEVTAQRGGHRHKKAIQGLVCVGGSCEVFVDDGQTQETYLLDNPARVLVLEPKDWHTMDRFSAHAVLLVFSSEHFDPEDYIHEPYQH